MPCVLHNGHEEITFIDIEDNMWMLNKKSGRLFGYNYKGKKWERVEGEDIDVDQILEALDELL